MFFYVVLAAVLESFFVFLPVAGAKLPSDVGGIVSAIRHETGIHVFPLIWQGLLAFRVHPRLSCRVLWARGAVDLISPCLCLLRFGIRSGDKKPPLRCRQIWNMSCISDVSARQRGCGKAVRLLRQAAGCPPGRSAYSGDASWAGAGSRDARLQDAGLLPLPCLAAARLYWLYRRPAGLRGILFLLLS